MTKDKIYQRELKKVLEEGIVVQRLAEKLARERTEQIFWDMVDKGRQRAKDRE